MSDAPDSWVPNITGDTPIQESVVASWARTLDRLGILWTFEPRNLVPGDQGRKDSAEAQFHLTQLHTILEIVSFPFVSVDIVENEFRSLVNGPLVFQCDAQGHFQLKNPTNPQQLSLLMYCPRCTKHFFSPLLETPCGFCGALKPLVHGSNQIPLVGRQDVSSQTSADLRAQIEQEQSSFEKPERLMPNINSPRQTNALFRTADADKAQAREQSSWEKLRTNLSGAAFRHQWPSVQDLVELNHDYPNFTEVCQLIIREIQLSEHKPSRAVQLPNLLLVGGPSCGKSSFAERLAKILVGRDFTRIDMGQATTNLALVGSDSNFKNSKEGRILRALAGNFWSKPVANPLVILDEIDKSSRDSIHGPLPALLSLLNKADAKQFTDEFFAVPVDASGMNFLALANTIDPLSEPLLSRFLVFPIQDYSQEEFVEIVIPTIYREWCHQFFPGTFPEVLTQSTRIQIAAAADGIPRQVFRVLDQLANSDHQELTPSPSWDGLNSYSLAPRGWEE